MSSQTQNRHPEDVPTVRLPDLPAEASVRLIQSALPSYRRALLLELGRRVPNLEVFVGETLFDGTVRTEGDLPITPTGLRNLFFAGRRLLWQRGALVPGITADVAILELNPRIVSVWVTIAARRVLGRPTILWGHAWPRKGRGACTDRIRSVLRGQADTLITYTASEAEALRTERPHITVIAAPNALYGRSDIRPAPISKPHTFLYVGRLTAEKKPDLAVRAFALAAPDIGDTRLILVGSGSELSRLVDLAAELQVADRVDFVGSITDPVLLRERYAHAIASVSPGCVGLSIVQSLGFGVPMIVADTEPHGPEVEAVVVGQTAEWFESDSASSLADALRNFYQSRDVWLPRRDELSAWSRERYSAERSAAGFVEAIAFAITCVRRGEAPDGAARNANEHG